MNSCIYEGQVWHRRFSPKRHAFHQTLYMMYLDLSELETVFRKHWIWSTRRPALAWMRRKDHMGHSKTDLHVSVRDFIESQTGLRPAGRICLLTHLRLFGFMMNPVSFYFCFDENEELQQVVAEVNNTPWGEQHCYLLDKDHFAPTSNEARKLTEKDFHVSPFLPMNMAYRWHIAQGDTTLKIGIQNYRSEERVLSVAMLMNRCEITTKNLNRVLYRYPLITARVFLNIYWQALILWWKKTPFFPHPKPSQNLDIQLEPFPESNKESV